MIRSCRLGKLIVSHGQTDIRTELDSHADTCVVGDDTALITFDFNRPVRVHGYDDQVRRTPCRTVTAVVAYDDPATGEVYMLHFHQAILVPLMTTNLLCPNQLRHIGIRVNDEPKHLLNSATDTRYIVGRVISSTIPGELLCMATLCPDAYQGSDWHPVQLPDLYAMAASNDPDTLTYQEAMQATDKGDFQKSMSDEINSQMKMGAYEVVLRSSKPPGDTLLPAVWAFRRKRKVATGVIYKHKARLNLGGHRMTKGKDYDETYAPVAAWPSIRLLLGMTIQNGWHTRQVDYVLAYPQAPIDRDIYMEIPRGCELPGYNTKDYILKIKRNVYGGKASGRIWYQYLRKHLASIGFKVSEHDECVFFKGKAMYVLYTDDSILAGPDPTELDDILEQMKGSGLDITSEGGIDDFLGVSIERKSDGTIYFTQQKLIQSILGDLGLLGDNVTTKSTPMASSKLLSRHPNSPPFDGHFEYRRVIGKLMYLEKSTRPDLAYAVHQCARFSHDPKVEHGKAVKWIGRYLKATDGKGLILRPSGSSLELYVDSDFAGNWDPEIAETDAATAHSRHGYILKYCGMPLQWASQLQSIFALSSTEAEYVALSRAVQDSLLCIRLLQEMKSLGYNVPTDQTHVHCKIFDRCH
jgi:Reverse transcriptase (RNA-dependent DNA polymerase)